MIHLCVLAVFSGLLWLLAGGLLLVEDEPATEGEGEVTVEINGDRANPLRAPAGDTLLATLHRNAVMLPSACGGRGMCGTCKCTVLAGGGDLLPAELHHLEPSEIRNGVRLACRIELRRNLAISIPADILRIGHYTATVVSNRNVATFIKELVLRLDEGRKFEFQAGAYMQFHVPAYEVSFEDFALAGPHQETWERLGLSALRAVNRTPTLRSYSLASAPHEGGRLMFTIRIATPPPDKPEAPPGVGSSYVFSLEPGDRVTLDGPHGDFFAKPTRREMCFVGGGAGMAPMRSHILHQLEALRTDRKITFWYGARSAAEMLYDEEFKHLAATRPGFTYRAALSEPRPEDRWEGPTGFIHRVLYERYLKNHEDPAGIEYYLCGPPPMIEAVTAMLAEAGVEPRMIAYDKFG